MARIAIDARMCGVPPGRHRVVHAPTGNRARPAARRAWRHLDCRPGAARRADRARPNPVRSATLWTPPHHRLERWTLPIEWLRTRCDLLHSPDFLPVRPGPWRTVITVHDLDFVRHPDHLTPEAQRYYGRIALGGSSRGRDHRRLRRRRATISSRCVGRTPTRITVVDEAADPRFRPHDPMRHRYRPIVHRGDRVPTPYFLFVGTIEPRKNHRYAAGCLRGIPAIDARRRRIS